MGQRGHTGHGQALGKILENQQNPLASESFYQFGKHRILAG
jgi:hypothetical protein